jgi:hypothetical protein
MHALLWIQDTRKALENIEFMGMVHVAMKGSKQDIEKAMGKFARKADVNLTFEE